MATKKGPSYLESLQHLSLSLGTTLDLHHESSAFMEWVMQFIRPELAALFIVGEGRKSLELVQALGFKAKDPHLALGQDPWQWLRQQGASLPPPGAPGCLALPLAAEGELLGLLALVTGGRSGMQEAEIPLAEVAAGFFALHLRSIFRHRSVELLAENAQDIIYRYELSPQHGFTYVSPAATVITGYTPEEHYADPDLGLKMVHPEDRPLLERAVRGEIPPEQPLTLRWVRKDGTVIWTEQRNVLLCDDIGNVVAIVGIARDITARKRAEEALFESEEKYRKLFQAANDVILVLDGDRFVDCNEKALDLFGCTRADIIGRTPYGDFSPPIQPDGRKSKEKALEKIKAACSGQPQFFKWQHRRVDGTLFGTEVSLTSFKVKGKEKILAIVRDISDRERAREALRESRAYYRALFTHSPVALAEADFSAVKEEMEVLRAAGVTDLAPYLKEHPGVVPLWASRVRFLNVNRAALQLFGYKSKREFFHCFGEETLGEGFKGLLILLYQGKKRIRQEIPLRNRRGNLLYLIVELSVLPPHADTLKQVLISAQDITERVRAQQEIEQSYAQVQLVVEGSVRSMVALTERRDPYTAGHQQRVAELACAIARELGLSEDRIQGLRMASLLHDIGKIPVPSDILSKPFNLSEPEFALLKGHPQAGFDILSGIDFPWPVAEIVRQHHERLDGSGHPQGLKGEEILLEAQILAVADVVEAMASHRPYRPARTIEEALEEIESHQGVLYNPDAVAACVNLFSRKGFVFPVVE